MNEQFRITPRPQMRDQRQKAQVEVTARPQQYGTEVAQGDPEVNGLIQGLSALNPALQRLGEAQLMERHQQDAKDRENAMVAGKAASQLPEVPREALNGEPIEPPTTVPPAFADTFRNALTEGLAQRVGVQNKAEAVQEYNGLKDTEGFDVSSWLTGKRQQALAGLTDPRAVAVVGSHFTELEASLKADFERTRVQRMEEVQTSIVANAASDMFTANMTPAEVGAAWPKFLDLARAQGKSAKDAAGMLFMQLTHASSKAGGVPELFDAFEQRDAEGMRLIDRNPQLKAHLDQARQSALQMRDKAIEDAAGKGNAKTLMYFEERLNSDPLSITKDEVLGMYAKHGPVQSFKEAAGMWNRVLDAQAKVQKIMAFRGLADEGQLWRLDPKEQGPVLDSMVGGMVQMLAQATTAGDTAAVGQVAHQLVQLHSRTGATVPVDQLQRYIKTLVTNLPAKEGPSTAFQSAAQLYRALSGNPQYRDMYFDEDTSKVLEGFTSASGAGTDPKTAYTQAYQSVSPEAKAAAEAFVKTPEFQKKLQKDIGKYVEGSSWVPRWLGGNGRPENVSVIGSAVATEMRSWRARNPFATDAQADAYADSWTQKNFVLDTTSNVAVKVPPGLGGQAAQEALSALSRDIIKVQSLGSRSDATWSVQYVPTGTEGNYHVIAFNGAAATPVADINLGTLLANERAKKVLSGDELKALGAARQAIQAGEAPALPPALIAKAEGLKVLRPEEVTAYRKAAEKQFMDRLSSVPRMAFGDPSAASLQLPTKKNGTVDNQLTAKVALEFTSSPLTAPNTHHVGLAGSLITMGEAVVLQAYDDPAHGAGKNIGMGYNLKANADKAPEDLRRAGVPPERVDDVLEGRASLTPDQAKRLLQVAMPRYEKQVRDVAEATSKGLWDRMTPAQRAVMIDVAWQVGDSSKFKKAWASLEAGDTDTFKNETKVFYTDRNGERREDVRRNNLRAAMLAGIPYWEATVQKFGSLPSSKLQAMSVATN